MFLPPTFFLNSFLDSSYFLHNNRKCFTFSTPWPQSHDGSSMMLSRFRWLFSRQCPVCSLIRFASFFRGRSPYNWAPVLNLRGRVILWCCLVFILPLFHASFAIVLMSSFI